MLSIPRNLGMELQGHIVTKPKLLLLIARQANKSGEELLEQGITILMGKLADREYGRLASQKSTLPKSECGLLLYTRGGGGGATVAPTNG